MGAGGHLSDWMAFRPGMELRRAMAMKIARANKPEGKGYTGALAALMMRDGLYDETTTTQPAKESSALSSGSVNLLIAGRFCRRSCAT